MKTIMYVSQVSTLPRGKNVPVDLPEIYQIARRNNSKLGVTGVLSYSNGHYLQVIEGDAEQVDQLFGTIKSDSRHTNVIKLIEVSISQRCFPKWSMRLVVSVSRDKGFRKFIQNFGHLIPNGIYGEALSFFYRSDDIEKLSSYDGKMLKLSSWPDFSKIRQTPSAIELCARLTSGQQSYDDLVSSSEFGTVDQINVLLRKFKDMGILVLSEDAEGNSQRAASKEAHGFYEKMRSFLGLG